ncbi:MAG TPA: hypothetical protein VKH37_07030, partial [Ferruginibacter sp.]|nr:hypothetical protein [Ferruginibacter sp.]
VGSWNSFRDCLSYMQEDVRRYFGLYVTKEKFTVPCYLLSVDSVRFEKFRTKGGKASNKLYQRADRFVVNKPFATLSSYLDWILDKYVVQQSNIPYNIDLTLPDILESDVKSLLQYLSKCGIILTPSTTTKEQFVIYQTNKN